jgi:hypothetical protein
MYWELSIALFDYLVDSLARVHLLKAIKTPEVIEIPAQLIGALAICGNVNHMVRQPAVPPDCSESSIGAGIGHPAGGKTGAFCESAARRL